ncbi:MAG: hypothetical protein AB1673_03140 [Actinomycetota bacterium]
MLSMLARASAGFCLIAAALAVTASPAAAGGSWLYPVSDRYEPGSSVTLVGYVGRGTQGWLEDGPFYGYLRPLSTAAAPPDAGLPVGPLAVEPTGSAGWAELRVSLEVLLPADLPSGHYEVTYCNDPCTGGLGDLVGSAVVNVGVAAVAPMVREWPLDEPMVRALAPDALVSAPGHVTTAADALAGVVTTVVRPANGPGPPGRFPPVQTEQAQPPAPLGPRPEFPVLQGTPPLPAAAPAASPASAAPASAAPASVTTPVTAPVTAPASADEGANLVLLAWGAAIAGSSTAGVLLALSRSGRPGRAAAQPPLVARAT